MLAPIQWLVGVYPCLCLGQNIFRRDEDMLSKVHKFTGYDKLTVTTAVNGVWKSKGQQQAAMAPDTVKTTPPNHTAVARDVSETDSYRKQPSQECTPRTRVPNTVFRAETLNALKPFTRHHTSA